MKIFICIKYSTYTYFIYVMQVVETDISQWEQKIKDLNALGQEMVHEGHFDAENIIKASQQCQDKLVFIDISNNIVFTIPRELLILYEL